MTQQQEPENKNAKQKLQKPALKVRTNIKAGQDEEEVEA